VVPLSLVVQVEALVAPAEAVAVEVTVRVVEEQSSSELP
jgi:hypothetical protein